MKRDDIIQKLKAAEADLRAQGVEHAALFGSMARSDDRPDSDIDIIVDLDPAMVTTVLLRGIAPSWRTSCSIWIWRIASSRDWTTKNSSTICAPFMR